MKKKIFSLLVLLAAAVSGAWAETEKLIDEGFEGGSMPTGWTIEGDGDGTWSVGKGDYSTSTGAKEGNFNALITHSTNGNRTKLITPAIDLSSYNNAILTFSFVNRSWAGDFDNLTVYYRTSATSEWVSLDYYNTAHDTWTDASVEVPSTACQIAFEMFDSYGYGIGVDNVVLSAEPAAADISYQLTKGTTEHGEITFTNADGDEISTAAEGQVVTVTITPAEGYVVNEPTGQWNAAVAAVRRRVAPENLDMLKDFDLQFVSEDPETHAQTYTFEMKRAKAEISVSYKKLLNNADITIENIADQTYTGQAIEPTITVKDGSTVLVKGTDYDVVYFDNVNAAPSTDENAPAVVITAVEGSEKYAGGNSKTFTILPATITDEMIAEIGDQTYTTNPIEPALTITFGEGENEQTLVKGTDFTVVCSNNVNVGVGTATVTGQGNFTGEASADFNIVSKGLTNGMISPIDDQEYTGEPQEPELDVNFNGKPLVEGTDYTVEYADNVEAGKATATITGIGNYTGEASANFYVGRVDLNDETRIKIAYIYWEDYDGAKHTPRVEVRDGMKPLVLDVDYKMTFKDNVEAGTARITFQGLGNYKGKVNKYFAIKSYVLDIDMVQDIADQTWTGEAVTPAISVINGNVTLTQDKDFTVKFKNNVNEGTATAIINGTGNFRSIDLVKTFKIVKKAEVTDPEAVEAPGEATAISGPVAGGSPAGTAYDLGGRKAKANRKGVVIIDGKLVLKK